MYLNYVEYAAFGGTGDDALFHRLAFRAEQIIDRYTQKRVQKMAEVPEAVKRCMTELINAMVVADPTTTALSGQLTGFTNDGYSESYAAPQKTTEAVYFGILADYLASETDDNGTPLLYRGVDA